MVSDALVERLCESSSHGLRRQAVCGIAESVQEQIPSPAEAHPKQRLTPRCASRIVSTPGCWDRVILTGTLPAECDEAAVKAWLRRDNTGCFDLSASAEPSRDRVRSHAILSARALCRLKILRLSRHTASLKDQMLRQLF